MDLRQYSVVRPPPPDVLKALRDDVAKELESHTLPSLPIVQRLPIIGHSKEWHKSQVVDSIVKAELNVGRKLEWNEREKMATALFYHSGSTTWGLVSDAILTMAMFSYRPPRIKARFSRETWFGISSLFGVVFGWVGAEAVCMYRLSMRMADPDLRKYNNEAIARLRQERDRWRQNRIRTGSQDPFPRSSVPLPGPQASPQPEDDAFRPVDEASPQSWPQRVQEQDPFGNHQPPPPPQHSLPPNYNTTAPDNTSYDPPSPAWQDDPLDEVEGTTTPEPQPDAAPFPRRKSRWAAIRGAAGNTPGSTTTTTPQQTWAERRRAALEQSIADKGGDSAAYAAHDEESSKAQSQAQREFDEMLERERRAARDDGGRGR